MLDGRWSGQHRERIARCDGGGRLQRAGKDGVAWLVVLLVLFSAPLDAPPARRRRRTDSVMTFGKQEA